MTIRKGEPWGATEGPEPAANLPDDGELAAYVSSRRGAVVSVTSGDLHRTLGLDGGRRAEPLWFPIDLAWLSVDGAPELPFVAHAVARTRTWLGEGAIMMNAAWIGNRYLGPKAHPNDGLLDITTGSLPVRQLIAAANRSKTGTHLPHPALTVQRVGSWSRTFDRPRFVRLDGHIAGRGRRLECRVESDWFTLVG